MEQITYAIGFLLGALVFIGIPAALIFVIARMVIARFKRS